MLREGLPGLDILDVRTHIGAEDPDGIRCSADELIGALAYAGARAVVFPMHEPGGYAAANARVLHEAARSGGRLVPFCRVDPARRAAEEALRCIDAGVEPIALARLACEVPADAPQAPICRSGCACSTTTPRRGSAATAPSGSCASRPSTSLLTAAVIARTPAAPVPADDGGRDP